jgi:hypothetical protein
MNQPIDRIEPESTLLVMAPLETSRKAAAQQ